MLNILSTKGINIWKAILLTFIYMILNISVTIGVSELLTLFVKDISLEIQLSELISGCIFLTLYFIFFEKKVNKDNKILYFPNFKFIFLTVVTVIGFTLIKDPLFRYKNIFLGAKIFNPNEIEPLTFSIPLVIKGIYIVIIIPIFEELFFRRLIFKSLLIHHSKLWISILISSLLFSIHHLSVSNLIPTFILGILTAYIYYKTNNIWYPIFLHILSNFLWFLIFINPKHYWSFLKKLEFGSLYWIIIIFGIGLITYTGTQYRKLR